MTARTRLLLLTGPKHSGKTTAAAALAERARAAGLCVVGLLAESVRRGGVLAGFDVVDLATGRRAALARRGGPPPPGRQHVGAFAFLDDGLAWGAPARPPPAGGGADLVIVDEFGPLEMAGRGWRAAVDELIASPAPPAVMLVVRQRLAPAVRQLYAAHRPRVIDAAKSRQVPPASLLAGGEAGLVVGGGRAGLPRTRPASPTPPTPGPPPT